MNYLGFEVPTKTELNSTVGTLNTAIAKKTDKTYVDNALTSLTNGASKFYPTLAEANADIANIAIKDKVEVGEIANGGTWYKATAEATSLTKSPYDPVMLSKQLAEDAVASVSRYKLKLVSSDFEQGNFGVYPELVNAANRVRSKNGYYFNCKEYDQLSFIVPDGFKIWLVDHVITENINNLGLSWVTGEQNIDLSYVHNLSFIVARVNDAGITPAVLDSLDFSLLFKKTDIKFEEKKDTLSLTKTIKADSKLFRQGSYRAATMWPYNSNLRLITRLPLDVFPGSEVYFSFNSTLYDVAVAEGTALGQPITKDHTYYTSSPVKFNLRSDSKKMLLQIKRKDNAVINVDALATLNLNVSYIPNDDIYEEKAFKTIERVIVTDKDVEKYLIDGTSQLTPYIFSLNNIASIAVGSNFDWGKKGNGTRFGIVDYMTIAPRTRIKFKVPVEYSLSLRYSNDLSTLDYDSGWIEAGDYDLVNHRNAKYLRIGFRKADNSATTVSDIVSAGFSFSYLRPQDLLSIKYDKSSLARGVTLREKLGGMITQAHSGTAYFGAAENSYDAFVTAGKSGFKVIEADLMITSDNKFVVSHNVTIDSGFFVNADGSAIETPVNITTLTLDQVRTGYLTKSAVAKYRKPIVTLEEFLDICRRYGAYPRIEIKQWATSDFTKFKAFVETTRKYFNDNDVQVISFFFGQLQILAMISDYMLGYLIYEITEAKLEDALKITDRIFIDAEQSYYNETAKQWIDSRRLFTSSWTAYNCTDMNRMIDLGVNQVGVQDLPPINGRPSGLLNLIWSAGLNFDGCTFSPDVSVIDGQISLSAGKYIEFEQSKQIFNGAFYADLCVKGDYLFELYVDGALVSSCNFSSASLLVKKFASFHRTGSAIKWKLTATTDCTVSDISFKDYQLDV